jgi:hypothetical protein
VRHQSGQAATVILAVFENCGLGGGVERRPLQDAIPHFCFVGAIDAVLAEISQRTDETVEAFFTLAHFDGSVVHRMPKFHVGIERAGGLSPASCNMATEFGREVVTDD